MRVKITKAPPKVGHIRAWYEPLAGNGDTYEVHEHDAEHYMTSYFVEPYKTHLPIRKIDCEVV